MESNHAYKWISEDSRETTYISVKPLEIHLHAWLLFNQQGKVLKSIKYQGAKSVSYFLKEKEPFWWIGEQPYMQMDF